MRVRPKAAAANTEILFIVKPPRGVPLHTDFHYRGLVEKGQQSDARFASMDHEKLARKHQKEDRLDHERSSPVRSRKCSPPSGAEAFLEDRSSGSSGFSRSARGGSSRKSREAPSGPGVDE